MSFADLLDLLGDFSKPMRWQLGEQVVFNLHVRRRIEWIRVWAHGSCCSIQFAWRTSVLFHGLDVHEDSPQRPRRRAHNKWSQPYRHPGNLSAAQFPSMTFQKNGPANAG